MDWDWGTATKGDFPLLKSVVYIVTCHLPRGSKLRWRENHTLAEASNLLGYNEYAQKQRNNCITVSRLN